MFPQSKIATSIFRFECVQVAHGFPVEIRRCRRRCWALRPDVKAWMPSAVPHTFELRQSMSEPCLTVHPDTGVPVRRVLSGGLATFTGPAATTPMRGGGGCGSACGCA
jgi:predicted nucleic acid-binding Zn ribbon protein